MKKSKGISLIVLIITIIVVIILAAVVILTLSKNNPIESAKEARFKEDVRTFQDELALTVSKQYTTAGGHWDGSISASTYDEIVEYIPSFTKKYEGKFVINKNNLEYTNKLDENEKDYAQNLNLKEKVLKLLPDEYQQVEYIESTGTQYIDMGVIGKNSVKVFISFANNNITSGTFIFGSRKAFLQNAVVLSKHNDGGNSNCTRFAYGTEYYDLLDSFNLIDTRERNDYFFDNTHIEINNNSIYQFNNIQNFSNNLNMYLFTCNDDGIAHLKRASIYLYECKIYDDKDLVRNFIPCYTTTTVTNVDGNQVPANTKGLYDLVEGKFYTNQGTGEFIAGPDVNE